MRVFRIEREKYLDSSLSGFGASVSKGFRWNSLNTRTVYTAENRSLACLEVAVHLDLNEDLPLDRYLVEIDIPDTLLILELQEKDLPENWDQKPPGNLIQQIGDDFVRKNEAAVLKVPSSVVPFESNYLINPFHAEAREIKVIAKSPLRFDNRLRG
jgi:RES domain-containing protein